MHHIKGLNRGARLFSSVSIKNKWKNLMSYITNEKDLLCWKELNSKVHEAENIVEQNKDGMEEVKKIDWIKWSDKIGNTEVLACMKKFYDNQMKMLDEIELAEKKGNEKMEKKGNEKMGKKENEESNILFEKALKNCKTAEEESERLLVNGAKALWVQFHNPPVQNVDNNEWIESDLYWKAFVEKHAVYNLNNKSLEPEDEENLNAQKNAWHKKTGTFNERSDTPILYDYMINLPSWEYYDINRRVFLEHLLYFLLRSGLNFRMFPELFKWKWLTHIEDLRIQFLDVAVKRKNQLQLKLKKRELPLELQPLDYEHHGEEFHSKMLHHFKNYQNLILSKLMANYIFLCDPYIPIQTKRSLEIVKNKYKGNLFKLPEDVNCLFYLPSENIKENNQFKPFDALDNFYSYLEKNNIQLNPSYSQMLNIVTELLQERGTYWLKTPNENLADSFLRRYNKDDTLFQTFVEYVSQLKEQFEKKIEIPVSKHNEEVEIIEKKYEEESIFFEKMQNAYLTNELFQEENILQDFDKMEKRDIQKLIDSGKIHIIDSENKRKFQQADNLIHYLQKMEIEKQQIRDFIKGLPN